MIGGLSDHTVSQSLYHNVPDGNEVELYVDNPAVEWFNNSRGIIEPVKSIDISI